MIAALTESIREKLAALAQFNATPGDGITRFPFTKEASLACDFLEQFMTEAGLAVRREPCGAVTGRLEGQVPQCILLESHYDTVLHGGAYDGIAGVVSAIEIAKMMASSGEKPYYSLEVMATNDEEGARFSSGFFSSLAACGRITPEYCYKEADKNGVTIAEAMKAAGLDPQALRQEPRNDIKAVFEIHCEQGPVLEKEGFDLGIVTTITGTHRALIEMTGRADHAGTTPMDVRLDPMQAFARFVTSVTDRAKSLPHSVTTIGRVDVKLGVVNIVPEKISFWIDYRSTTTENIGIMEKGMFKDLEDLEKTEGIGFTAELKMAEVPTDMDPYLKDCLKSAAEGRSFDYMELPSGAGHDAQVFAALAPAAMVFVPSVGGRSHCPVEKTDEKYLAEAVLTVHDALVRINKEKLL